MIKGQFWVTIETRRIVGKDRMARVLRFTRPETAAFYRKQIQRMRELWNVYLIIPDEIEAKLDEKGISIADVRHVVFYGRITHDEPRETKWRYTLKGKSIDGDRMKCIVDINGSLVIVTAFLVGQKG